MGSIRVHVPPQSVDAHTPASKISINSIKEPTTCLFLCGPCDCCCCTCSPHTSMRQGTMRTLLPLACALRQMLVNIGLAEQRGDLARIADLKYGALPEVDQRLKVLRDAAPKNAMLTGVSAAWSLVEQ